jgi:hypothetical protein
MPSIVFDATALIRSCWQMSPESWSEVVHFDRLSIPPQQRG